MGVVNAPGIPVSNCDPTLTSQIEFVGPGTPNPKDTLVPQGGRFSPAVGFAWQVPWFGEGKTTVRGGFQRTYGQAGSSFSGGLLSGSGGGDFNNQSFSVNSPAINAILKGDTVAGAGVGRALTLADLPLLIPTTATRLPAAPLPLIANTAFPASITYSMYAPGYVTPYQDNFTLSVTRNIAKNYTLDIRFVDTLGRKQPGVASANFVGSAGSLDLNQVNVYHNPELFNALVNTRAGLNDPFFDQLLLGVNLNPTIAGYGPVGTVGNVSVTVNGAATTVPVLQRGSAQIRRAFATSLANGDFVTIANSLMASAVTYTGLQTLPPGLTAIRGRVVRNGCDRLANGAVIPASTTVNGIAFTGTNTSTFSLPDGSVIGPRCFAENFLTANQAFGTANLAKNFGHTNYQSGQVQFTARPTQGVSIQGTLSLSKTMNLPGSGYTDPLNRDLDYSISNNNIGAEFRSNAVIELPIGPNKLIFGNSSGWFARAI